MEKSVPLFYFMKKRKYRFFYHYNKQQEKMTIHFKGKCEIVDNVICQTTCETKWNKSQPKVVMQGFTTNVVTSFSEITGKVTGYILK
jgi:hypothetical protein